jgi:hypothetical protein
MGQEFATGYPDLDTGLPTMRYTRDLMTPQAWVGVYAYPGNDPKWFLEYQRAVTKRWIEQLRFQRGGKTSGFSMFSAECWFSHGYDASRAKPYPVLDAVKQAYSPVGLALETYRRRFYASEDLETTIFVTNDDENCRALDLSVKLELIDRADGRVLADQTHQLDGAPYYGTLKLPIRFVMPNISGPRHAFELRLTATAGGKEVGRSVDPIEVFARPATNEVKIPASIMTVGAVPRGFAISAGKGSAVILVGAGAPAAALDGILAKVEGGATAVLFSPDMQEMLKRFPDDIYDDAKVGEEDFERRVAEAKEKKTAVPKRPKDGFAFDMKKDIGEFVDWTPARGTKLVEGLEPMDLRWWGRKNDWRAFVSTGSFRLKPTGKARELFRYIPAHGYIPAEKVPWQMRTVLFELPVGKGRLWVCNLELADSVGVDPVADLVFRNLVTAAADPNSTANLKPMPSHEDMLKGKLPN